MITPGRPGERAVLRALLDASMNGSAMNLYNTDPMFKMVTDLVVQLSMSLIDIAATASSVLERPRENPHQEET